MRVPFVDLSSLHAPLQPAILQATDHLLKGGVIMGGEAVQTFEAAFAKYIGTKYCISCGNGTDALEIILRALNIKEGDEVIVPANGWMSAAEAARLVGATPVFVDSHPQTYAINPGEISARITERTRAIIPIHLYGLAADLVPIMKLAHLHNIKVVEDCAQAHGAAIGNRKVGSIGDAAAFSFYPTKNLGALGDGGAMLTNDALLADKMRSIANHGQVARDQPVRLGRNSRMDALQASILGIKLPYLDKWNEQRRQRAHQYRQRLVNASVSLPIITNEHQHVHHLFVVRVRERNNIRRYMEEHGISTQVHYPTPVPALAPFRTPLSVQEVFPVSHRQAPALLSLPLHPTISPEAVDYVCDVLKEAITKA